MLTLGKKILLTLFFGGLIGLWWADYAHVPTSRILAISRSMVLPELFDVRPGDVRRIEIENGKNRVVLERETDHWELASPVRALAASARIEGLIGTLKTLRKSGDAGSIQGNPDDFGLKPPATTIRLFGNDLKAPMVALELGKIVRDQRYVRDPASSGVDLVDPRLLAAIESPAADWRQRSVIPFSPIDVTAVSITSQGRELEAERVGGRWEIVKPMRAPGDEQKLEGLVADLVGLEVADGAAGFLGDSAKDLARFGLEPPAMSIEVRGGKPERTHKVSIGAIVPTAEGRVYARRSDDAETVVVPSKLVQTLKLAPTAWRSKRLSNFDPNRVNRVQIRQGGIEHVVEIGPEGWQVVRPSAGKADLAAIQQLLGRLSVFEAIEIRDATPELTRFLEPPEAEIRLWQDAKTDSKSSKGDTTAPALVLAIGRLDNRRGVVNVRVAGDPTVLGLAIKPVNVLDLLPNGPLGFRDRSIFTTREAVIDHVTIRRDKQVLDLVAGDNPMDLPSWRMTRPVSSTVDTESLGRLVVLLARMRADRLVSDSPGDLKPYGLDRPAASISWTVRPDPSAPPPARSSSESGISTHSITIGGPAPVPSRPGGRFAQVSGAPTVFTLSKEALGIIDLEFHDHRVLSFRTAKVQFVSLRWPDQSRTFRRKPRAFTGPDEWESDLTQAGPSIDAERLNTLITNLANLSTPRFAQYEGPFPIESGLARPRLTIDVSSGTGVIAPMTLRIGYAVGGFRYATVDPGNSGAVFLIPSGAWEAYIDAGKPKSELPDPVFTR